ALAAHFRPMSWGKYDWLWLLALGAGSALLGGLFGSWLFGRLFATPTALWIAVLATFLPWLVQRLPRRSPNKTDTENLTNTEKGAA
ncbi:MAG TPA: hypothetical protein VFN35_12340, partial [Ktedonobacteraceae bacterium]|nr:hypothetical protein [Ktedonobacteraceae bacterium]